MSFTNVVLYLTTIASPFVSVYAIRYLRAQYGARSLILSWINLELLVCVSLIRPILFLAKQMTESERLVGSNSSINSTSESLTAKQQHHSTAFEILSKLHHLEERMDQLETSVEGIKNKPSCNCNASCKVPSKRSLSSENKPVHRVSSSPPSDRKPKGKSHNVFVLLLKVWMVLFFNFIRAVIPFTGGITAYCLNKIKSF